MKRRVILTAVMVFALCVDVAAKKKPAPSPLDIYLDQARQQMPRPISSGPSLFTANSPMTYMFLDVKARSINDIVTIQILESATASNTANTQAKKGGDANAAAPSLFGLEKGLSALNFAKILDGVSGINFQGQATTTRSGQLQASISARVSEVLPNGDLVIEGVKQVTVNDEHQILKIRGVVRPRDVSANNLVLSSSISHMEVQLNGRGIVSDANQPALLYRLLRKILPF